jgi:farnesol dehydrogenase
MMHPQSRVFVTGGTGFIGMHLVQTLAERGYQVRALSRRGIPPRPPGWIRSRSHPLADPRVEVVAGDVTLPETVRRGMLGCRYAFHLAGYARNWSRDRRVYDSINVEGMGHVLRAAAAAGLERTVVTSTIVTLGPTRAGQVGDESMIRTTPEFLTDYERSKAWGEQLALDHARQGAPVVVVNPTRVFGPGLLSEGNALTRLIDDFDRGRFPISLNHGRNVGNYVLVDDVVSGHLLAMERGQVGQRYILAGENATLREFLGHVTDVSGKAHWQLPIRRAALAYARLLQWRANLLGIYPPITPGWVRTFLADWAYHCEKARQELGYQPTPLADAVRRTYQWLQHYREERRASTE